MATEQPQLKKARIEILTGRHAESSIPVRFNPTEYTIEKSATYARQNPPGRGAPITQFVSGESESLSMELFFDTHDDPDADDVRHYTSMLDDLLTIDGDLHAPPICKFVWGNLVDFTSVVESASKQFTMFDRDGFPVRARVSVSFTKYERPLADQTANPRASADRSKLRVVRGGETLWLIAADEYGDPTNWRPIADANAIEDPRTLDTGLELIVPPLED